MHLHQLKYFVSIVETGSVTRAAERCFISQPSISQQLHKLEDGIGKQLFSRVKGKLILTDAGQVMKFEEGLRSFNGVAVEAEWRMKMYDFKDEQLRKFMKETSISISACGTVFDCQFSTISTWLCRYKLGGI